MLNEKSLDLMQNLDKNENAEVHAGVVIYPGILIEIGHASFVVNRILHRVRFFLDKAQGKIIYSSTS